MSEYFPEPKSLGGKVKIELQTDLKNATGVDTSSFPKQLI